MKKVIITIVFIFAQIFNLYANSDSKNISLGFKAIAGARFDNMRMCVATPAGVKGGPMADFMLRGDLEISPTSTCMIEVPLMRPILFGLAFKMLQFEPQISIRKIANNGDGRLVYGPGIGASFHYGPDYKSDLNDNKGPDFFAAGPLFSFFMGANLKPEAKRFKVLGLRVFYIPLFSQDSALSPGTVLGSNLEFQFGKR